MKVRKIRKTFWWISGMERKLYCKIKPLPGMKFVGRGKGTQMVQRKKGTK